MPPTLELLPEALAEALGAVVAMQRREWQLEHDRQIAEQKALLADAMRLNAELRAELKSATEALGATLEARVKEALESVRDGADGPPGPPGESVQGDRGDAGERGIGIASIERDGNRLCFELDDGRRFDCGELPSGPAGERGAAGVGVKDLLIDRDGILIATCDDGSMRRIGLVVGKDGADGAAGRDGLPVESFNCRSEDGGRYLILHGIRDGMTVAEYRFKTAVPLFRGQWSEEREYLAGDEVLLGGNCHIALRDQPGRPHDADGWQLKQKKAADGVSAYELALREGFRGTRKQWLESLHVRVEDR